MTQHSEPGGVLGPELTAAIAEVTEAMQTIERLERELTAARRHLSEARARMTALAVGARRYGTRALVEVPPPDPAMGADGAPDAGPDDDGPSSPRSTA